MAERPILFSARMVKALLDGRKTQTRRVVKLLGADCIEERAWETHFLQSPWPWSPQADEWLACPYGVPGDRLWVRETWAPLGKNDPSGKRVVYAAGPFLWGNSDPKVGVTWPPPKNSCDAVRVARWRPSIHMPRWASRITLEVTGVRVERLCNISEDDALAEGALAARQAAEARGLTTTDDVPSARRSFRRLWESINGADSWAANPWVWVVSFKRVEEVSRG